MEELTKIKEQKATKFYNAAQFQEYLISQGGSNVDSELMLYYKNCKLYGCETFGHLGLEKYYNADEVNYLVLKHKGQEFMQLLKENVPVTINIKNYS
tara:strand:- start:3271 stop:3561 length:291 start_codon:yes stop_codon:yes gene_type:complete